VSVSLALESLPDGRGRNSNVDVTLSELLFEKTSFDALGTGNERVEVRGNVLDRSRGLRSLVRDQSLDASAGIGGRDAGTGDGDASRRILSLVLRVGFIVGSGSSSRFNSGKSLATRNIDLATGGLSNRLESST